jgi:hypothetical protein
MRQRISVFPFMRLAAQGVSQNSGESGRDEGLAKADNIGKQDAAALLYMPYAPAISC